MCVECATANAADIRISGTVYVDPNLKSILDFVDYSSDYDAQRLPVAYTRGCSPTQPLQFALSNPTGRTDTNTSIQASAKGSKASSGWPIDLSESFLSTRLGLRVPLFPYIKVGSSDRSVTNLCAAPYAKLPPILKGGSGCIRLCSRRAVATRFERLCLLISEMPTVSMKPWCRR
jgi:hypothetical protein